MSGIFYDATRRRLHLVQGTPRPEWIFVTHNLNANANHCRRILRESLPVEELCTIDWNAIDRPANQSA